jgi:hypothetical protein
VESKPRETQWFVDQSSESPTPWFLCLHWGSLSYSQGQLQAGSLSTTFLTPLSSCFFPSGGEADLHKLPKTHHTLGSSRATPSHRGGFTSKTNKCFMTAWRSSKCSRLRISAHNTNLSTKLKNLAPKAWISQREFGESSWGYQKVVKTVRNQQPTRVGVECLL